MQVDIVNDGPVTIEINSTKPSYSRKFFVTGTLLFLFLGFKSILSSSFFMLVISHLLLSLL